MELPRKWAGCHRNAVAGLQTKSAIALPPCGAWNSGLACGLVTAANTALETARNSS
jgi:hypothetical protein